MSKMVDLTYGNGTAAGFIFLFLCFFDEVVYMTSRYLAGR